MLLAALILCWPVPAHQEHAHGALAGPPPALAGLDPVELCRGNDVHGKTGLVRDRNGYRYLFSSPDSMAAFDADPGRYEIQLGGGCGSMGPLSGAGDPDRYAVHDGHVYIFASDQCRQSFRMKPERYLEIPEVAPTTADMAAARAVGRTLLERVVEGVGGAQALDGLTELVVERRAERKSGEETHAWSEGTTYDLATGAITRITRWDDYVHRYERGSSGLSSVVEGEEPETRNWAAAHEFDVQASRELVYLLRQRGPALDAWADGSEDDLIRLVLRWNEHNTTAWVEPESGRVVRLAWTGRLGAGAIAPVVVDLADFGPVGPLTLPRARTVTFDGKVVDHRSGPLARLEAR
jgi:YHS domain-containing protein